MDYDYNMDWEKENDYFDSMDYQIAQKYQEDLEEEMRLESEDF